MSGAAVAQTDGTWQTKPEWFVCEKNEQCVLTCGCLPVAVNTNYADRMREVESCTASRPCTPEDTVECVDHQCQVIHLEKHP